MKPSTVKIVGRLASFMAVAMYVSYIPQIIDNLNGNPGNPLQPLVAFVNCILWFIYGFYQKPKDWPIVIANAPGIVLALIAAITAVIH